MRVAAILMIIVVIAATLVANSGGGKTLFAFVEWVPGKDVTLHFVLYFVLGGTVAAALIRSPRSWLSDNWIWLMTGLGLLVGAEEFSQSLIATRTFSLLDLFASLAGLACGALLARLVVVPSKHQRGRKPRIFES